MKFPVLSSRTKIKVLFYILIWAFSIGNIARISLSYNVSPVIVITEGFKHAVQTPRRECWFGGEKKVEFRGYNEGKEIAVYVYDGEKLLGEDSPEKPLQLTTRCRDIDRFREKFDDLFLVPDDPSIHNFLIFKLPHEEDGVYYYDIFFDGIIIPSSPAEEPQGELY